MPAEKTTIILAGPTAVGKTALSIELAGWLDTAVISADSRQCYREMRIGTAKPAPEELRGIPHYFIDSHSVADTVTAATFETLALGWLEQIFASRAHAIVCGGTGLYIKALCEGLDPMPATNPLIEQQVVADYNVHGLPWLQDQVRQHDPAFASGGEMQNPARLLRALSFKLSLGRSILDYRRQAPVRRPFHMLKVALELPRAELYRRIDLRVEHMMEQGLLEEVQRLLPFRGLKSLNTVGYRELFAHLDGKWTLDEAVDKIKQHTRNYAKRQLTWFKKDPAFHWFHPGDVEGIKNLIAGA